MKSLRELFGGGNGGAAVVDPPETNDEEYEEQGDQGEQGDVFERYGFNDEEKGAVEAHFQQQEEAKLQHVRQQLLARGLDFAADGTIVKRDEQAFQSAWGGQSLSIPQPPVEPPKQEAPVAPVRKPLPDPISSPEAFEQWVEEVTDRKAEERANKILEQVGYVRDLAVGGMAQDALRSAADGLESVGLAHITQHPAFLTHFQDALTGVDPKYWRDPGVMGRIAMTVVPDLLRDGGEQNLLEMGRPRDARSGRFLSADDREQARTRARSDLMRDGLSAAQPTISAGGTTEDRRTKDPTIALYAERRGISYEEAEAWAQDETGQAAREVRAREAARRRR
jgi:hypothetical protein